MVVITTHTNADFDSLASMVAALHLYPEAKLVFPGAAESVLRRFMEGNRERLPPILPLKELEAGEVERLVCVDLSNKERMGPLAQLLKRRPPLPLDVFDHHPGTADLRGERHVVREAGSCTAVMVSVLEEEGIRPAPFEATLFLLAIYEDTGFLTFPTTRPEDFRALLKCIEWGGDLGQVSAVLHRGLSEEQMRLLAELFENLESVPVGGFTVHLTTLAVPEYVPDLSLLVHEVLAVEGLETLFLLASMESRIHVIARSRNPRMDVGRILSLFGGGGHPSAGSAVVRDKTLEEVRALVLEELTEVHPVGLSAADVMTRDFRRIASDATVREAFREMNRYRVNALPVFTGRRLVGVVTRQEVDGAVHHGLTQSPITDLVISAPPLLPPETPAEEVRRLMLEHNWRIVLFGPSPDKVEGLLSRMTLFKALYHQGEAGASRRTGGQPSAKEMVHLMAAAFLPEELAQLRALGEMAAKRGASCLLVGGAVRDLLLGQSVKDVDFVVEGDAVELAEAWAVRQGGRIRAHRAFGTAVWIRPDGSHWDFATARAEYYETPAALPTVEHAALFQDLYRRDFTINTLALYLTPERFGEVLDLFGGTRDLKAGRIRVLHGLSFVEDPTRAFRAVRFAVRLGFTLPPETERLIAATAKQGVFRHLSPKRVLAEVNQILSGPNAVEGLKAMEAHKLLQVFWPAFKLTPKTVEALYRVQKALDFFETHFPEESLDRPCVYFMALLERHPTAELEAFLKRYPVPRKARIVLERYRSITWHALRDLGKERPVTAGEAYRVLVGQPLEWVLFLLSKVEGTSRQARVRDHLVRDRFVCLAITGRDLVKAGIPESAAIAHGLAETRAAKVDGRVSGRQEELAYAVKKARAFLSARGEKG
jgi:tRNA nucleotidyltransferase (CCA-adding enzyme)